MSEQKENLNAEDIAYWSVRACHSMEDVEKVKDEIEAYAQSQLQELRDATLDLEPEMSNTMLISKEDVLNLIDQIED